MAFLFFDMIPYRYFFAFVFALVWFLYYASVTGLRFSGVDQCFVFSVIFYIFVLLRLCPFSLELAEFFFDLRGCYSLGWETWLFVQFPAVIYSMFAALFVCC